MSSSEPLPQPPRRGRRHALIGGAALLLASALAGCGFRLRGDFAYAFARIYINTPANAPIAVELRRAIEASGNTRVVDSATEAEVILELPAVGNEKQVLSLSGGGRVREFALATRVSFRLHDATGRDWLPASEIVIRRSYSFNESEVLAREAQEVRLLKEMQSDAVQQILRQMQAARRPA